MNFKLKININRVTIFDLLVIFLIIPNNVFAFEFELLSNVLDLACNNPSYLPVLPYVFILVLVLPIVPVPMLFLFKKSDLYEVKLVKGIIISSSPSSCCLRLATLLTGL